MFALLIDPEKYDKIPYQLSAMTYAPDFIFVGGSTCDSIERCVDALKKITTVPVILFPGSAKQFCTRADAILFHTLLSSANLAAYVEEQTSIAPAVIASKIETIPMGYILIDGGRLSSVQIISNSVPIAQNDTEKIKRLAMLSQLLGKQIVYLEAGSGALIPISKQIISLIRKNVTLPLIVGGGITSIDKMKEDFEAGADIVVIGNYFENHPDQIEPFVHAVKTYNENKKNNVI